MTSRNKLISAIRKGNIKVTELGLEITRRCNYKCGHCYLDDAQTLDMNPHALHQVFDYFTEAWRIHLFGGEKMCSPQSIKMLDDALGQSDFKFRHLSLVTNCSFINEEVMDTLESIKRQGKTRKK